MAPRKNMFKLPENVHIYIFVAIAMAGIIASTTYISQQLINRTTVEGEPTENEIRSASTSIEADNINELPDRNYTTTHTVKAENTDSIIAKITDSVLEKKKKKKKSPVF